MHWPAWLSGATIAGWEGPITFLNLPGLRDKCIGWNHCLGQRLRDEKVPITFRNKSCHGSFLPLVWACLQTKTVLAGGTGGPFSFAWPAVASNCKLWPHTQLLACGLVLDIDRSNICRKFGNELKTCWYPAPYESARLGAKCIGRHHCLGQPLRDEKALSLFWICLVLGINALAGIIVWDNDCRMPKSYHFSKQELSWKLSSLGLGLLTNEDCLGRRDRRTLLFCLTCCGKQL